MKPVRCFRSALILTIGALLAVGCAVDPEPVGDAAPAAEAPPEPALPGDLYRGTLEGAGDLSFTACGAAGSLPLRPVDVPTRDLLDEIAGVGSPVYIEFRGRVGGRIPGLTLTRLEYAARESRGCDGPAPGHWLRGQGNEPFWSLTVRPEQVEWATPETAPANVPLASADQVGDGWLLTANATGLSLEASFAATPCRDSMADAWFGYTVQVSVNGSVHHGCGRGGAIPAAAARRP